MAGRERGDHRCPVPAVRRACHHFTFHPIGGPCLALSASRSVPNGLQGATSCRPRVAPCGLGYKTPLLLGYKTPIGPASLAQRVSADLGTVLSQSAGWTRRCRNRFVRSHLHCVQVQSGGRSCADPQRRGHSLSFYYYYLSFWVLCKLLLQTICNLECVS